MNDIQKVLTTEQSALVAELTETYGIEPEDIMFFSEKPEPFLSYEATCTMCNVLTNFQEIDVQPIHSVSEYSLSVKCTLIKINGSVRSAPGVANFNETIDGKEMSDQQILALASARSIRNALKTAGIDLMKLHQRAINGDEVLDFRPKSNFNSLLKQAHALGTECGLIRGNNKRAWAGLLANRHYVEHSNELTETELADFVAFLKTLQPKPEVAKKAA